MSAELSSEGLPSPEAKVAPLKPYGMEVIEKSQATQAMKEMYTTKETNKSKQRNEELKKRMMMMLERAR